MEKYITGLPNYWRNKKNRPQALQKVKFATLLQSLYSNNYLRIATFNFQDLNRMGCYALPTRRNRRFERACRFYLKVLSSSVTLLVPEDKGITFLRGHGNCLPVNMTVTPQKTWICRKSAVSPWDLAFCIYLAFSYVTSVWFQVTKS
jgi:hypothetical protein